MKVNIQTRYLILFYWKIKSLSEDLRMYKEKIREYEEKAKKDDKHIKAQNDNILKLETKYDHLTSQVGNGNKKLSIDKIPQKSSNDAVLIFKLIFRHS